MRVNRSRLIVSWLITVGVLCGRGDLGYCQGIKPIGLKCEYAANPLGIETRQPRLFWLLESTARAARQSACQILVASSQQNLQSDIGDMWDTGKVASDQSIQVVYHGQPLQGGARYWWKVRVWDEQGRPSDYSPPATFDMGLPSPNDWHGQWIAADEKISAPLLRRDFVLHKEIRAARAYVCGLGWHELYLNGHKVSDHVLDAAPTNYHLRALYVTHDVTEQLRKGANTVAVLLGGGWYLGGNVEWLEGATGERYGPRSKVLLQLNIEFTDGTRTNVVTDQNWKFDTSPITTNSILHGESYDARLEQPGWNAPGFDETAWRVAQVANPPPGKLSSQTLPPIRVDKTIRPLRILRPDPGVYVYDFGQHFSGWARLRVRGERGTPVKLRCAGRVDGAGRLDPLVRPTPAHQTDTYILKGDGDELWEPRFTLHGFRFVEVTGFPGEPSLDNLEGRFLHSSVEPVGRFHCSNGLLNQIHQNVWWTLATSFQGIPQDAADREERVGWLGDTGFVAEDYIYNFDTASFWAKWLRDVQAEQQPNGQVPVVSPGGWMRPWTAWQSTYPLIAWYVYQYYGDQRILDDHYDSLQKLVAYLGTLAEDHVITEGLGDHMEPQADGTSSYAPRHTPPAVTSTAYYYFDTWILAQAARVLGKMEDAERYEALAARIKAAFNREFLDEAKGRYGTGSQTCHALALHVGLVPKEHQQAVLRHLVDDILVNHQGHFSTGIIGTNALEQALPAFGRSDVMYTIATRTTFPGWGYQISRGATTVWETLEYRNDNSLNMKMFCSTEKFFFHDLAGIRPASPGFGQIAIKPQVVDDLDHVEASLMTVRGRIEVAWKRGDKSFDMQVTLPANTTGLVSVPTLNAPRAVISESGTVVWQTGKFVPGVAGILSGVERDRCVTFEVGSGAYDFQLSQDFIEEHDSLLEQNYEEAEL